MKKILKYIYIINGTANIQTIAFKFASIYVHNSLLTLQIPNSLHQCKINSTTNSILISLFITLATSNSILQFLSKNETFYNSMQWLEKHLNLSSEKNILVYYNEICLYTKSYLWKLEEISRKFRRIQPDNRHFHESF